MDVDPDQVQIECMIDKDGKEVKQMKPILIKLGPGKDIFLFTDEERVSYADRPYEPKIEEETDDDDYVEDDILIEVDSDSSAALSMLDKNFENTDPLKIDEALQQIIKGLCQAAKGYEALKDLLPTIPVTEVAKIVQVIPTPYLQPMSKAAIQVLQTLGEEDLINQACLAEFQKGVSQAALMRKYGIGRDRLYKALHSKIRPGGTQYQMLKKEETKVKTEPSDVPVRTLRGKARGKTSVKT